MEVDTTMSISKLNSLLINRDFGGVLHELQNSTNKEFVQKSTLEIIPEIGSVLIDQEGNADSENADFCLEAFKILAQVGNAKEVLMGFLEQLEYLSSDVRFHVLLYPIQAVLLRLPKKRGQSLEWVFSSIHGYVKMLPVPMSYGLEGQELLLLDNDPDVLKIQNVIESIIDFCRPFIKEVSLWLPMKRQEDHAKHHQRQILAHFILKLLGAPLAMVDLSHQYSRTKSTLRNVAELLVANMCELEPNFYRFAIQNSEKAKNDSTDENSISALALATFSYLVHAEDVCKFCIPFVYSHSYTFEVNLFSINYLLRQTQDCAIHKGLLLLDHLLQYLRMHSICQATLDLANYDLVTQCLIDIMIFCKVTEFRKLSLTIFVKYIEKFTDAGRYRLLYQLIGTTKHAGVQGLLIQLFKNNVVAALQQNPPASCFVDKNMKKMIHRIFVLADGAETDLLADCERILEALNLCRYLFLRDSPTKNVTGIWDHLDFVENSFTKPLQLGLDLSKAHFELELKNTIESGINAKEDIQHDFPLSVMVEGSPLPAISHQHKLNILQNSILGLELIQSVLSIVNDLVTSKKQYLKK